MPDRESREDTCDECAPKEGDRTKKTVHKCESCNRWFCERHIEPRLAYIKDWRAIDDSPESRALYYTEMQRKDGHPDFAYSYEKIIGLHIEEKKRNDLIKRALDRMNHYYDEPVPEKTVDEETVRKKRVEMLLKEEAEIDKGPKKQIEETKMLEKVKPNQIHFSKKHKNLIIATSAVIIAVVILVAPMIPTQQVVTKVRSRDLRYSSGVYGTLGIVPKFVNVTNTDSIGGTFTIKMYEWYIPPVGQQQLQDTSTQSAYIEAGATHRFDLPSTWYIFLTYSFTYSVSPPITQESYQETQTEYKSILNLIESQLGI